MFGWFSVFPHSMNPPLPSLFRLTRESYPRPLSMPISTANSTTANNRRRPFCQPGGVSHTFAVSTNWLNVHAGIMYSFIQCSAPAHFMWTTIGFAEKLSADFIPTELTYMYIRHHYSNSFTVSIYRFDTAALGSMGFISLCAKLHKTHDAASRFILDTCT